MSLGWVRPEMLIEFLLGNLRHVCEVKVELPYCRICSPNPLPRVTPSESSLNPPSKIFTILSSVPFYFECMGSMRGEVPFWFWPT
jgi:hypothetical protein